MTDTLALSNPLSDLLGKDRTDFTRADLLKVVRIKGIERFTFR